MKAFSEGRGSLSHNPETANQATNHRRKIKQPLSEGNQATTRKREEIVQLYYTVASILMFASNENVWENTVPPTWWFGVQLQQSEKPKPKAHNRNAFPQLERHQHQCTNVLSVVSERLPLRWLRSTAIESPNNAVIKIYCDDSDRRLQQDIRFPQKSENNCGGIPSK